MINFILVHFDQILFFTIALIVLILLSKKKIKIEDVIIAVKAAEQIYIEMNGDKNINRNDVMLGIMGLLVGEKTVDRFKMTIINMAQSVILDLPPTTPRLKKVV